MLLRRIHHDFSCNIALGWLAAGISLNCAAKLLKNKSIWEGAACCCGLLLLPIFITILCSALLAEVIADVILSSATSRRLLFVRLLGLLLLSVPELYGVAMEYHHGHKMDFLQIVTLDYLRLVLLNSPSPVVLDCWPI